MGDHSPRPAHAAAPGTEKPRRFRPKLRYELIGCGLHGHEILGTDAAVLRPEDELFARESGGLRWYRCMRCDSWVALTPPDLPARKYPPSREEITLPLRGKPLRDRYVLRLIALDRLVHFLALSGLAAAVLLFAGNRATLNQDFTRILKDLQGGLGGPVAGSNHGIVHDLQYLFAVNIRNLYLVGAAYLLYAKRLFGLRGGGKAERAEHDADTGWNAIERATPKSTPEPLLSGAGTRGGKPAEVGIGQPQGRRPGGTQRDIVAGGGFPAAVGVAADELQAGPPAEIGRGEGDPEQAEAQGLRVPLGDRSWPDTGPFWAR